MFVRVFGFLRVSEFTTTPPFDPACHLAPTDVEFLPGDPSPGLRLCIKFSKTDPAGAGHFLYIGVTGTHLCPVLALRSYLAHRGSLTSPLFGWADRSPLTAEQVDHYLRVILSRAFVLGSFSSPSVRIGAATPVAAAGLPDRLIQTLGSLDESGVSSLHTYHPRHVFERPPAAVGLETSGGGYLLQPQ